MTTICRENIRAAIESTNGAIFSCEFIKADGTIRKMVARTGVKRHLRGGNSTTKHRPNLITVWDTTIKEYRAINLDTVKKIKMFGKTFELR